ncbi:MAG: heme o synthase [Rhizobiaceae bacterium]|nr:heme o synthase [Rhizobiaceae bacterium]
MPGDYYRLMKPRVMYLVIFTAFVGMLLAPANINPLLGFIAILCISIGAGASGSLNMWYDADIDAVMDRTAKRPVPTGAVTPDQALSFGIILSVFSVITLGLMVNWLSAFLLAFTIFFYAVIYTMWLKRSTPQNIVIGGAAGAFPPMIGWAAMTGSVTIESIVLFAIIFLWTPPHFWALALFRLKDYENASVPMLPNVAGERSTRNQILGYAVLLALSGILPAVLGFASIYYGVFSAALGARFLWLSFKVWKNGSENEHYGFEKKLFGFSIFYLFAIFAALGTEAVIMRVIG